MDDTELAKLLHEAIQEAIREAAKHAEAEAIERAAKVLDNEIADDEKRMSHDLDNFVLKFVNTLRQETAKRIRALAAREGK